MGQSLLQNGLFQRGKVTVIALTDDGMEELEQMLHYARRSTQEWDEFLDSFVDDKKLVARIKANSPR